MATPRGLVGAAAALAVLSGCGGKPAGRVSGRVSHKGRPGTAAEVHFYSKERGVGAVGKIDRSGGYALAAPLEAGTYEVSVRPAPSEPGPVPGPRHQWAVGHGQAGRQRGPHRPPGLTAAGGSAASRPPEAGRGASAGAGG